MLFFLVLLWPVEQKKLGGIYIYYDDGMEL
jgi:hypothetical protein